MEKIDIKKEMKAFYQPSAKEFTLIEVPEMQFVMVDGTGNPNTEKSYQEAIEALYSISYTLKFMSKKECKIDYVVPPLEGLWWAEEYHVFTMDEKSEWLWTMMIMAPQHITDEMFSRAVEEVRAKKNPAALDHARWETYEEGLSVQIMHIGPYSAEGPTLAKLHDEFMPAHQLAFNGKHHEIYLSDPRRVDPENMKTVLRQPVKKVE